MFGVLALLIHRRRRRILVIRRIGEDIELAIDQEDVHALFPITCHGTQMTIHVKGAPMYEIYLQLVGANQRGITLHEARGTIHGPERDWFPSDIDRSVASPVFDVPGAGTLRKMVDRVRVADASGRWRRTTVVASLDAVNKPREITCPAAAASSRASASLDRARAFPGCRRSRAPGCLLRTDPSC